MSREYPNRPVVAVGAAVCREGHVLLVRRGRPPGVGTWTVPGGGVDLGERMEEAAIREVREECGVEIEVGEVVGVLDHIVRDEDGRTRYHYAIVDFGARYVSGTLSPNEELLDATWVTPDQLEAYGVADAAQKALLRALALFGGGSCSPTG
jgi:8-oxo-dGTP diphosphatase